MEVYKAFATSMLLGLFTAVFVGVPVLWVANVVEPRFYRNRVFRKDPALKDAIFEARTAIKSADLFKKLPKLSELQGVQRG